MTDDAAESDQPPPPPPPSAGVSTTDAPGQTFDEGEGRIFPCERCGADLEFHIGQQKLVCPYCGSVKEIELSEDAVVEEQDLAAMLSRIREWRQQKDSQQDADTDDDGGAADDAEHRELRCSSCGGNVEFIGTLTSTHCPYCGSPMQLEDAHKCDKNRIPVDGVLAFQVDRDVAKQNLRDWANSRWFAPNDFRKKGAQGQFNGVYLSYFTFDAMTFTAYRGQRGDYYYVTVGTGKNKRQERRTRWTPASGQFQRFFDDVLVLANTGLRRDFMLSLEPWPLQQVVPFNQQVLAGCLARTYDVELDDCFGEARERIDAALRSDVEQRIGGDTQSVDAIDSQYDALTFKHLLLPVWLLAYSYQDKPYQVFINAATGEVQGERPYSMWKIAFAVIGGILAGGIAYWISSQQ